MIETSMFDGDAVRLAAVDPDQDANTVSAWSYDLDIARMLVEGQPRPLPPFEARKTLEGMQKELEEANTSFLFGLHLKADERLVGILRLTRLNWTHAVGRIELILGEEESRHAVARDALALGLQFAFRELNLYRVTMVTPEYDYDQIDRLEEAGLTLEARLRQFVYRADRLWDQLHYGILQTEWQSKNVEVQA